MHGAEQFSIDVELALAPGTVADPHGDGLPPARQVGQLPLGQVALAADSEHDLQVAVLLEGSGSGGGHVLEELVRLIGAGRHPQRLDGERGVSDPGVAVVPVPGAADSLGQRGGGRRADGTGGLKRQRLEYPSAVVDQISPRTDVGLVQPRPRLPCDHGVVQPRCDLGLAPHPSRSPRRPVCGDAGRSRPALPDEGPTGTRRTNRSTAKGTGHDRIRTSAPPVATSPPSTASSKGNTRPYSGRGTYSRSISTSPELHVTCRSRRCGASLPRSCPRLPSPIANASTTTAVPVAVR